MVKPIVFRRQILRNCLSSLLSNQRAKRYSRPPISTRMDTVFPIESGSVLIIFVVLIALVNDRVSTNSEAHT